MRSRRPSRVQETYDEVVEARARLLDAERRHAEAAARAREPERVSTDDELLSESDGAWDLWDLDASPETPSPSQPRSEEEGPAK